MRSPWFNAYEKADMRGARMHVCMYAFCVCTDCGTDPELRRRTAIDRSQPQTPKVGGAL
ncbi:hypothetical protein [Nocardia asiatica]|uniref:hypothetical protein n=1 Tax=Nocardia asiatica TaxID=209252 RepID=UPI0012FB47D9|nr:hypothetical protein [Nocardia asiatica]